MVSAQTLRTLFRYILSGGTAAVVDFSIFTLLHGLGVTIPVASACSSGVAVVVNYTLSSTFVFKMPLSLKGFLLFFLGALVGLSINNGVVVAGSAVHLRVSVAGVSLTPYQPYLAKVAGIGTAFLFNFWLNSTFVFRGHATRNRDPGAPA
jgi:putative flippase GtrA